jgi:hypothetical protein
MPRTPIPVFTPSSSGQVLAGVAVDQANGMIIPSGGPQTRIVYNNSGAAAADVIIAMVTACPTCQVHTDKHVTVAPATMTAVGNLNPVLYGQQDGSFWVDFTAGAAGTIYATSTG